MGDSQNKIIYCLLRAAVGAFGLLILLSFAVAYLFFGSEGEGEAESSRLSQVALFVYALALLLPHRWFLSRQLLPVKAVVLAAGGIWMLYTSAAGISAYYDGTKHIAILPVSTAAIVISIVAPATLLMRISRPSSHLIGFRVRFSERTAQIRFASLASQTEFGVVYDASPRSGNRPGVYAGLSCQR